MTTRTYVALLSLGLALTSATARGADPDDGNGKGVYLELPLVDLPANAHDGYTAPGMQQSLWITTDLYQGMHYGLGKLVDPYSGTFWKRFLGSGLIGLADFLTLQLPFGSAWLHEEWHRAVMSRRGISSYNDVYDFQVFAGSINVSHVLDADLARLKEDHPAEFVRMSSAGIEGNYELSTNLAKTKFFQRTRTFDGPLIAINYILNTAYMASCAGGGLSATQEADVTKRDFTGADCIAWTYDLFRPDEPYAARGLDPSGVGIRRYRRIDDLSPEARDYLDTQASLSFLNFLDPAILGFHAFEIDDTRFNANVRHMPTSFGSDTAVNFFYQRGPLNLFLTAHAYFNRKHFFPGITAEWIRWPVRVDTRGTTINVTLRSSIWLQPVRQQFDTSHAAPGGDVALKLGIPSHRAFEPYVELEGKTPGWVAGNVYLDPNVAFRVGLISRLY